MAFFEEDMTVVIKSVKVREIDDVIDCVVRNTPGFVSKNIAVDSVPDFSGAKIVYCNYQSSFHARKAVEVLSAEGAKHNWGDGLTRAATKDKMQTILRPPSNKKKDQPLSQLFPVFVTGFLDSQPQQVPRQLQELFSEKYGPCFVKANFDVSSPYAFVNFHNFDSALAALNDSRGIKYNDVVLKAHTALDTAWAVHVWNEMKQAGKISFTNLNAMASSGVRTGNGKKYIPKEALRPLQHINHFRLDMVNEEVTWATAGNKVAGDAAPDQVVAEGAAAPAGNDVQNSAALTPVDDFSPESTEEAASLLLTPNWAASALDAPAEPMEVGTPSKFLCPISQQIMQDPVRLSSGVAYDRFHIESYLRTGRSVCPLTQLPINPFSIMPDLNLKNEILEYEQRARMFRGPLPIPEERLDLLPSNLLGTGVIGQPRDERRMFIEVCDFNGGPSRRVYSLGEFLGGGGMGKVYRARRQGGAGDEQPVALKICDGRSARSDREALNLQRLQGIQHDNVVKLYDSGLSVQGHVVLVMEIVEPGLTLTELLEGPPASRLAALEAFGCPDRPSGPLPLSVCTQLMSQILSGMEAVHVQGIAHRDLKPSNVMMQQRPVGPPRVVIIDFGLSKATYGELDHSVTLNGQVLGTPAYMSPEQILGLPASHAMALAADVWAMGIIFHMMVEGRHPFAPAASVPTRTEAEKSALIQGIQTLAVPPLQQAPEAQRFVESALEKRVELRFASAKEMREAFVDLTDRWRQQQQQQQQEQQQAAAQTTQQTQPQTQTQTQPPAPQASTPTEGSRGGSLNEVEQLLLACHSSLQDKVGAAREWFDQQGLDSVSELKEAEMEEDFVAFLQLKEGRARILKKRIQQFGLE